ncbi:MAG: hypothetical protein EOP21_13825 [Hyphomicrobiales bacterium]|nr:MAG: hypothetical protein EOP21_13825 [Hyphomicrobiales bacterium]
MTDPVSEPRVVSLSERDPYLDFFLAHIDEMYAEDTNADIGLVFVALAYPWILVVGPPVEYDRCIVDVTQHDCRIEPDCYPLKQFLETYPHVCRQVIEAHGQLHRAFMQWRDAWGDYLS